MCQEGVAWVQAPQGRAQLLRAPRGPQGQGSQLSRVRGQGWTGGRSAAGQVGPAQQTLRPCALVMRDPRNEAASSAECEAWQREGAQEQ